MAHPTDQKPRRSSDQGRLADPVAELLLRASNSERRAATAAQQRAVEEYRKSRTARRNFASELARRLDDFWSKTFRELDVLLQEANDAAAAFHRAHTRRLSQGRSSNLVTALLSVQSRAILTAFEVLCLARNGHPQGAYARLRTIQELNAFSTFISRHGEETARRFCDYAVIEIHGAELAMRATGGRGMDDESLVELETKRSELIARYGAPFGKNYGWAADALGHNGPKLIDILKAAGSMNPIYREASLWVHSSAVGVLGNAQSHGNALQFITGPNDDRLGTQLHGTALGVVFTTLHLLALVPKDKQLRARSFAVLRLGQVAIESATQADARWLRMHPTYRTLPQEGA